MSTLNRLFRSDLTSLLLICFGALMVVSAVRAEEAPAEAQEDLRYVELKPTFVANFGPTSARKLMYVKTDVAVRVSSKAAHEATLYHLPALRNALVMLLSRQEEAALISGQGREQVRADALASLNEILQAEEGESYLQDLMFTNFIVQR